MKPTRTLIITLLFMLDLTVNAQVFYGEKAAQKHPHANKVWIKKNSQAVKYIELNVSSDKTTKQASPKSLLDIPAEVEIIEKSRQKDANGAEHIRHQLHYKGIPVEGAILNTHHINKQLRSVNTDYTIPIKVATQASISANDAISLAKEHLTADSYYNIKNEDPELVILPLEEHHYLCYKVDVYAQKPLSRNYVFVDATNGQVRKTSNRIHAESAMGIAHTKYQGIREITTDFVDLRYALSDRSRGAKINTLNMQSSYMFTSAINFFDMDNTWDSHENQDDAATNAHFALQASYDYFKETFNRSSFDNNNGDITAYVHFGENYSNAFWDGQSFVFGDGDGIRRTAFTSTDVVAHEYTHALTAHTAALVYENEPGALNESFSDIFGVTIDLYTNPTTANYELGEEFCTQGIAARSMANPKAFNDPDTYLGEYWVTGEQDHGGIHSNCGVQNYWFYLLAEGGSGTNDLGNHYQVYGIGIEKAAQIAYRNLTVYLTPNSQYADARFYSIQAAIDLFGECSDEVIAVTNAWHAVGLGEAINDNVVAGFEADSIYIGSLPATIALTNTSENAASYLWKANGKAFNTDYNPYFETPAEGIYNIELTAFSANHCVATHTTTKTIYVVDESRLSPVISQLPQDTTISLNEEITFDLAQMFDDPAKNNLYFHYFSDNYQLAQVSIEEGLLKINPQETGSFELEISATNTNGLSVSAAFMVNISAPSTLSTVRGEGTLSAYPNPAQDFITICLPEDESNEIHVQFFTSTGQMVQSTIHKQNGATTTLYEDISGFASGVYKMLVSTASGSQSMNIIKN